MLAEAANSSTSKPSIDWPATGAVLTEMPRAPGADPFEDLAEAIGMLVISFNELEIALGGALMHILGQDEQTGAVFASHLSASAKLKLLDALKFKIPDGRYKNEFIEQLQRATEVNSDRNRFIHSEYWSHEEGVEEPIVLHRKLRDARQPTAYPVTVGQLSTHIKTVSSTEIGDLANDAASLASDILHVTEKLRPEKP